MSMVNIRQTHRPRRIGRWNWRHRWDVLRADMICSRMSISMDSGWVWVWLTWRDHRHVGRGCGKLGQLRNMKRASAGRQCPLGMRSWHAIATIGVVRRAACGSGLAYNLLGDTARAWNLKYLKSATFSGKRCHCSGTATLAERVLEAVPFAGGSAPTVRVCRLTFLSHLAFALAQCTQAIGIRSVGESIMNYMSLVMEKC